MGRKSLETIENEIEHIKVELQTIGVIRPGSLTLQYRDRKERSGGFYQLSYTHRMKSRTAYIRSEFVDEIRQQVANYKRFKKLVERWVVLGIEYSQLSMKRRITPTRTRKGPK